MTDTQPPRPAFAYIIEFLNSRNISRVRFADQIHYHRDHVRTVLNGTRLISHECAHAIEKAYPELKALGLLHQQAKWRIHQLDHPELYPPGIQPRRPGARRLVELDFSEVRRLYATDMPVREIAHMLGTSLGSLYIAIDQANIPRRGTRRRNRTAE
jgi:plasmid maintenance system antidote protein VapI